MHLWILQRLLYCGRTIARLLALFAFAFTFAFSFDLLPFVTCSSSTLARLGLQDSPKKSEQIIGSLQLQLLPQLLLQLLLHHHAGQCTEAKRRAASSLIICVSCCLCLSLRLSVALPDRRPAERADEHLEESKATAKKSIAPMMIRRRRRRHCCAETNKQTNGEAKLTHSSKNKETHWPPVVSRVVNMMIY